MRLALSRVASFGRQALLTVGAVVGTVCILLAFAAVVLGVRPLVFESGSMSPTIDTGALAISREVPASSLAEGQVVSVPTSSGERVTHRIVSVTHQGGTAILVLRGDANPVADSAPYPVTHADRVLFDVPRLGYVVGWLTGPLGLFVLGLYAAFLLSVVLRGPPNEPERGRTPTRRGKRAARRRRGPLTWALTVVLLAGLASGLVLPMRSATTLAAWVDAPVQVSGTRLTAYTVPAPDGSTCTPIAPGTSSVRGVRLTWPATASPLPPLSYTTPTVSVITTLSKTVAVSGSDRVLTVTYDPGVNANKNKIVTVTDTAFPTGSPSWLSPVTAWKFRTGGNQNAQPVCGDATPPTVAFAAPDATTRTVADEKTFISGPSGCTVSAVIICGTIDDASNFVVTYNFKRVVGSTTRCWSGSSWVTSCTAYQSASSQVVGNLTSWYATGNQATAYPTSGGAGVYTLTVRATDDWANVTTQVLTFTLT